MRNYCRKTERGKTPVGIMKRAAESVINEGISIRSAAKNYEICRVGLKRFIDRYRADSETASFGYKSSRRIFTDEQEKVLCDYLKQSAQIYFGLTPKNVRTLAYECAKQFNLKIPDSWEERKQAGADWFTSFLKRQPALSLRSPEATSLGRATSFNKSNVQEFYNKLKEVMDRYSFTASNIWNIDETGVSTVTKPPKIVGIKGARQTGALTSGERGTNVTVVGGISACGMYIPPMFLFPRKHYKEYFVRGGPPDCVGAANISGWMTKVEFLLFMKHFVKYVKPTKESPVLLLLDNHESHLDIPVLNFAKENGVVMLSFPPHCSHRLQPLDVGVYGPFKKYLSSAQDAWMRNNAGKSMTIYDIPSIVSYAYPLALCPVNIINGFKKTGIFPFDQNVFTDVDFSPSYVTDRPCPIDDESQKENAEPVTITEPVTPPKQRSSPVAGPSNVIPQSSCSPVAGPSNVIPQSSCSTSEVPVTSEVSVTPLTSFEINISTKVFSPHCVRPLPKAGPRQTSNKGRKRRHTAILTDTPEKSELEKEQAERALKKMKVKKGKVEQVKKKVFTKKKQVKIPKNVSESSSESETDDCFCLYCCEPFSQSMPSEEWIQCLECKKWAHSKCISGESFSFVCLNCNSDDE